MEKVISSIVVDYSASRFNLFGVMLTKLKRVIELWRYLTYSPQKYAKHIGVNIGTDNFVADKGCWSSEPYLITIGNHCAITKDVRLFTHGGARVARNLYPNFDVFGKIVIGDWVYIGSGSLIMPGVTIGNNVLVAAGSVVTRSVPSGMIVAGNPARIIGSVDDYIKRNMPYNLNSKRLSRAEKRKLLLSLPDDSFIRK